MLQVRAGWRLTMAVPVTLAATIMVAAALVSGRTETFAGPLQEAGRLFEEGRFKEAAALAEEEGSAEGLSLAAASLGAHGLIDLPRSEREAVFAQAVRIAETGLKTWPEQPSLLVAAATALGRYGSAVGNRRAFDERVALRARDYLVKTLEVEADHPAALAGLGGWHVRLASEGGFLAKVLMGADKSKGRRLMERAEPLVLDEPDLLYELGRTWHKAGSPTSARRLLEAVLATDARGVYADYYRTRAEQLLGRL